MNITLAHVVSMYDTACDLPPKKPQSRRSSRALEKLAASASFCPIERRCRQSIRPRLSLPLDSSIQRLAEIRDLS